MVNDTCQHLSTFLIDFGKSSKLFNGQSIINLVSTLFVQITFYKLGLVFEKLMIYSLSM